MSVGCLKLKNWSLALTLGAPCLATVALGATPTAKFAPESLHSNESAIWNFGFPTNPAPVFNLAAVLSNESSHWGGTFEVFDDTFSLELALASPEVVTLDPYAIFYWSNGPNLQRVSGAT